MSAVSSRSSVRSLETLDGSAALNGPDAAKFMGISTAALQRLRMTGQVKSIIIGRGNRRYLVSDLTSYLQRL